MHSEYLNAQSRSVVGGLAGGAVKAPTAHVPFGSEVQRTEALAEQLSAALERIDYRISGRSDGRPTECGDVNVPRAQPSLERTASAAVVALERCIELAQRIAGDVGALD